MRATRRLLLAKLYRWHRYAGLTAAAFVAVLVATGLALNHTEGLSLDQRRLGSEILLGWYGMDLPDRLPSHVAGDRRVTWIAGTLYLDDTAIDGEYGRLTGAVATDAVIAVALAQGLVILTPDGRVVERVSAGSGIPARPGRIGLSEDGRVVIAAGDRRWVAGEALLTWESFEGRSVDWSRPSELPPKLRRRLARAYRGQGLTLERVLLDVHSGRILGHWGVWLVDAAAVLFLFLAATGFYMWLTARSVRRRRSAER